MPADFVNMRRQKESSKKSFKMLRKEIGVAQSGRCRGMKVYGNRMGVFLSPVSLLWMGTLHNLPTSLGLPRCAE